MKKPPAKLLFLAVIGALCMLALIGMMKKEPSQFAPDEPLIVEDEKVVIEDLDKEKIKKLEDQYNKESDEKTGSVVKPNPSEPQSLEKLSGESLADFDYEGQVKQRVGEQEYQAIMARAKQAATAITKGDKANLKEVVTPSLMQRIETEKVKLLSEKAVTSIDVFPTEQVNEHDVIIGSIISAGEIAKSYSLIFVKENNDYLADDFVLVWSN